jgi:hypothetical protein
MDALSSLFGFFYQCGDAFAFLVLAACGGSSAASPGVASIAGETTTTATGAATPAASAADREATLMQASKCMRDNGIADFPDPVVDWSGSSTGTHSVTNCLALLPVALIIAYA